jgi:predicted Fe-Mo cluster-binding NifX family protein
VTLKHQETLAMKIAVSVSENRLEAPVEQRFGRSRWFLIYNLDSDTYEFIENIQQLNAPQGAGIQSAGAISREGVEAVITGHMGPKAFKVLKAAGVDVYLKEAGTIQEAVDNYKAGKLTKLQTPNVEGHWI